MSEFLVPESECCEPGVQNGYLAAAQAFSAQGIQNRVQKVFQNCII